MIYRTLLILFVFFNFISTDCAAVPYYDDFGKNEIDFTKWKDCQRGNIEKGKLWLDLYGANSWISTRCNVVEENITNRLSSLVSISSNSYTVSDSSVAVKIGGIFYNDTFDGSSGYNNWEGNVFADVRLQLYKGTLRARAVVVRYNNRSGSSKTSASAYFSQPVTFDTEYLLAIEFVGSSIIFKCNDESLIFYAPTSVYPTNKLNRRLSAIVYADKGESGYVKGAFDDVCMEESCSRASFLPAIYLLLRGPVANAGIDQNVLEGETVTLNGSLSHSSKGKSLTYEWTIVSKPLLSTATLSDSSIENPSFTADIVGSYLIMLIVNDGNKDSKPDFVTITADKPKRILEFQVVDAEYSRQMDKIIMISSEPIQLHIFDPLSGDNSSVNLPLIPTCVSVSPDGLFAAVGHDGWVSYINLNTVTLEKTIAVSTDVLDIVLAGNGYIYAFPARDQWERIRCVNIATEIETLHTGRSIRAGTLAKLHPDGIAIYGADNGLSPSDIEKYDITSGTAEYLYDSPYHGDYAMCGDLWISEDGLRIFTRCGNVFRASNTQALDMTYNGSLSELNLITHLSHSISASKVVVIPEGNFIGQPPDDTVLQLYDYTHLVHENSIALPRFRVGQDTYPGHGKFVFFNNDGTQYYVIMQADNTSGLLYDYAIIAY